MQKKNEFTKKSLQHKESVYLERKIILQKNRIEKERGHGSLGRGCAGWEITTGVSGCYWTARGRRSLPWNAWTGCIPSEEERAPPPSAKAEALSYSPVDELNRNRMDQAGLGPDPDIGLCQAGPGLVGPCF